MMIPNVLAAFLSRFILLLVATGSGTGSVPLGPDTTIPGITSPVSGCCSDVNPALMPFICRCLFRRAAATLLLKHKMYNLQTSQTHWQRLTLYRMY